jgi:hypothetical protein
MEEHVDEARAAVQRSLDWQDHSPGPIDADD